MIMSKKTILLISGILIILATGILLLGELLNPAFTAPTLKTNNQKAGLANPASVNCFNQGGKLEIRKDADGGEYGVCIFNDKSECEEWALFRGECKPSK